MQQLRAKRTTPRFTRSHATPRPSPRPAQDKSAGAEALSALEARCADAEARIESLTTELGAARGQLHEAGIENQHVSAKLATAEGALARSEERLASIVGEEKTRREALTHSLRKEALSRSAALEEEVRTMEITIADLQHQLQRAQRDRGGPRGGRAVDSTMASLGSGYPLGVIAGAPAVVAPVVSFGGGANVRSHGTKRP